LVSATNQKRPFLLRVSAYNVFSHAEFSAIRTTIVLNRANVNTDSTLGQCTGTRPPRQMAMTLRFEF
jgi:hypothetical protein